MACPNGSPRLPGPTVKDALVVGGGGTGQDKLPLLQRLIHLIPHGVPERRDFLPLVNQARRFPLQHGGYGGQLAVPCGNDLDGGKGRIGFPDILKFVDNNDRLAVKRCVSDRFENHIPAFDLRFLQQTAVEEGSSLILEVRPVLSLGLLAGQKEQCLLILDEL